MSSELDWKFSEPQNVAVITSFDIIHNGKAILWVSHDIDDGSWQFHTGKSIDLDNALTVSLLRIVKLDPTIQELCCLPLGWIAERTSPRSTWTYYQVSSAK
jgi:hypothetical protein